MKRNPEIIDTCRAIILDKWMKVYHDLQKIIGNHIDGYNSWMNIWCPKPWYPIQCDFSAFLSPKWFKRFVLPDIISQSEQMDYVIYHLDGPDALIHLDELLNIPSITGIQWVPGAGKELKCSEIWMPVYKKIQNAGKKIYIDGFELPERLVHFYNELDPKELFISIIFMDYFRAKFYLPKFVRGEGNEGDFKKFKVKHRKELKQKNNNF
jgi:5-methyltetrahydrofolate--homocysteine methyltransferase